MSKLILLTLLLVGSTTFAKPLGNAENPFGISAGDGQQGLNAAVHQPQKKTPSVSSRQQTCGSKKYCKQMSSCAEAKFYLNHCGLSHMDGDHDGIPCEREACQGSF
jgi:hypothetical protein